jgi:hypothetical protein
MADTPQMPPSRALVLNVMLSLLASSAVFVVVAWLVLVPQLARHEVEIRALRAELHSLKEGLEEEAEIAAAEAAVKRSADAAAEHPASPVKPAVAK